jgi:hypothetical protein
MQGYFGNFVGGGGINSVQTVTVDFNSDFSTNTTVNKTITAVDTSSTLLIPHFNPGGASNDRDVCNIELTSSTNILFTRAATNVSGTTLTVQVIEFNPASILSNQVISASYTSSTPVDIAISSVDTGKAYISNLGYDSDNGLSSAEPTHRAELTSDTNARLFCVSSTGSATVRGQVIEFV